jgi:Protein of unknown function (DUF3060)
MTNALVSALIAVNSPSVLAQTATMTMPGVGQILSGDGSTQTMKCKNDALTVNGNQNLVTITGNCKSVTVNGDTNKVSFKGKVGELIVNGEHNTVIGATLGKVSTNGSSNVVTWSKSLSGSQPSTTIKGTGNTVKKR